jgi:glycosyltransferase involved in cell wall biosynthesis
VNGRATRRVVHHIPTLRHGGAERQLAYLAPGLRAAGWDVHVVISETGANLDRLRNGGGIVHELSHRGSYDPRALAGSIGVLRALQPAIVHTWLARSDILGGSSAVWCGFPWILGEGSAEEAYPPSWQTRLRARLARRAAGIVSNSKGGDRYWERILGDRVPRFIVGNALPLREIDVAPPMNESSDEPLVVYAGRLSAEKNVERLIDALAIAVRRVPFHAVLCGGGPARVQAETAVARSGNSDRIVLAGEVPTAWPHMKAAAVFVSVSTFEGSPNTVLEAMGCGAPLVLSDIPAHRELVGDAAIFVNPLSIESIAAGLVEALTDPDRRARVAKARAIAETATPECRSAELADVYERVLSYGSSR